MRNIKVKKSSLIEVLKKNLSEHREVFLSAQKNYREAVIKTLDDELAAVRDGQPFVSARITALIQPSDHSNDYERAIGMMEMDINQEVELSETEYSCYVDDNWGWMRQFANETSNYGVTNAKLAKFNT